jgi:hypothetical protein
MPKYYTIRDMVEAWDQAYGEDLNDEEGFIFLLKSRYGREIYNRNSSRTKKRGVKRSRKLSGWQKFIKKNSNKRKFKYASGKLNLKKMGIAYRKTREYKMNRKKR